MIKLCLEVNIKKMDTELKQNKIKELLSTEKYISLLNPPSPVPMPYDYNIKILSLSEKCKVFNSATRPICFTFTTPNGIFIFIY